MESLEPPQNATHHGPLNLLTAPQTPWDKAMFRQGPESDSRKEHFSPTLSKIIIYRRLENHDNISHFVKHNEASAWQ